MTLSRLVFAAAFAAAAVGCTRRCAGASACVTASPHGRRSDEGQRWWRRRPCRPARRPTDNGRDERSRAGHDPGACRRPRAVARRVRGFQPFEESLTLRRGTNDATVTLVIAGFQEEIVVADTASTDDRRGNSLTTTLEEADIAELPDDPDGDGAGAGADDRRRRRRVPGGWLSRRHTASAG